MPKNLQPPGEWRFGDRKPSVLAQKLFEWLLLQEGFVHLLDSIDVEIIGQIDPVELQDFDPFGKLGEL